VQPAAVDPRFLAGAVDALGRAHVLTDPEVTAGHGRDWTGRFQADPVPVLRPGTTDEVADLVALARAHGVGLVPQGGNTGLVGGGVAMDGGVVVDLRRLGLIGDVDPLSGQLTAGAGATIAAVQAAARAAGWAYGVDWAARDTATVGGSVATDAGGLHYVRHGGTRRHLLGVEAVLGTGAVVSHLPRVAKDNTGYHLASVLCGSEGTLGLVTAARLRLVRPTGATAAALVGFHTVDAAVEAAASLRRGVDPDALELVFAAGVALVCRMLHLPVPAVAAAPVLLLIELADAADGDRLAAVVADLDGVVDAALAGDPVARRRLWRYREGHTEAIARLGPAHKLDVTVPLAELAGFVHEVPDQVKAVAPAAAVWLFGHVGDGNVHVNVTGVAPDDERVDDVVLRATVARGGSISAEHGIGRAKVRWLHLAHTEAEIDAMRALRRAFDPDGICNPGVLLPDVV
jgi:FAD/FMN-containing dehydrogenase